MLYLLLYICVMLFTFLAHVIDITIFYSVLIVILYPYDPILMCTRHIVLNRMVICCAAIHCSYKNISYCRVIRTIKLTSNILYTTLDIRLYLTAGEDLGLCRRHCINQNINISILVAYNIMWFVSFYIYIIKLSLILVLNLFSFVW